MTSFSFSVWNQVFTGKKNFDADEFFFPVFTNFSVHLFFFPVSSIMCVFFSNASWLSHLSNEFKDEKEKVFDLKTPAYSNRDRMNQVHQAGCRFFFSMTQLFVCCFLPLKR